MGDTLAGILLLAGAVLAVIGGIGVHKFPDAFTRLHAASKATTLGLLLVVGGAAVVLLPGPGATKLVLVVVFQVLTAPVAAHLVGRAGYDADNLAPRIDTLDELADDRPDGGDGQAP
jgi:multicomponent Na+:H+ antiporter subunit G